MGRKPPCHCQRTIVIRSIPTSSERLTLRNDVRAVRTVA